MNKSSYSLLFFGGYLSLVGLTLLFIPNFFLNTIGLESTKEVWIRLSGILIAALAVYYIVSAVHKLYIIYKITVYIRCSILLFFSTFVYLDMMEPVMLIFAIIDFIGGSWTYYHMKKEGIW